MTTVAMTSPHRRSAGRPAMVASVVPPIVASSVRSSTTLRYGARFSTIRSSDFAPRRSSSARR